MSDTRYEMSPEHKAQMAIGREQSRIVRNYLEALRNNHPKRGRKRTVETIAKQLDRVMDRLAVETNPVHQLNLMAERDQLQRDMSSIENRINFAVLERSFGSVVLEYSQRKGISYQAWRSLGVPAALLRDAGLRRAA